MVNSPFSTSAVDLSFSDGKEGENSVDAERGRISSSPRATDLRRVDSSPYGLNLDERKQPKERHRTGCSPREGHVAWFAGEFAVVRTALEQHS